MTTPGPGSGFALDDAELDGQARIVDELLGRLRTTAGASTPLGSGAYGLIGQVFAQRAMDAASTLAESAAAFVERGERISNNLAQTRQDYHAAEASIADIFRAGLAANPGPRPTLHSELTPAGGAGSGATASGDATSGNPTAGGSR